MLVLRFERVSSTQDIAKSILKENVVIVADEQTAGRGRMGRKWYSSRGGLWMTAIFKKIEPPQIANLAGGIAVVKSLENFGLRAYLKWPNDVIYNGKKICGIIGEVDGDFILIGIGINLKNEIPEEIGEIAINAPHIDRDALLPVLMENLENEIKKRREEIIGEWKGYDITLGKRVKIVEGNGEIVGMAYDLDENGFLILDKEGIKLRIFAGDLKFL